MADIKSIRKNTGRMIRIERIKHDLQQKELAKMTGLAPDHLGKLERGDLPIRVEHIVVIAEALKCDAKELLPE